ncbi:hypothetical protein RFE05_005226 [Klebsiella pneumoniae]|uniref:hypothetical protein n=1 Tax=Klebsiella aerogenes TaxID=548 RepID=UPI00387318F3
MVQHANVVKAARDVGVKHIAYTGYAFAEESIIPLAHVHLATEYAIRTTNIPYTFLRNALYTDFFVNEGLRASIESGAIVTNAGSGIVIFRRRLHGMSGVGCTACRGYFLRERSMCRTASSNAIESQVSDA